MPLYRGTRHPLLAPPRPLPRDTFTDPDGMTLPAHPMDAGAGWTVHAGGYDLQSGRASPTAYVTNEAIATVDAGRADANVSVVGKSNNLNAAFVGLLFRYASAGNFWLAHLEGENFTLYENSGGTFTVRGQTAFAHDTNDHTITATVAGTSISVKVDGANELTFSSSLHQAATRYGLYGGSVGAIAADFTYDNFEVTA